MPNATTDVLAAPPPRGHRTSAIVARGLARRRRAEVRFRLYGIAAVALAAAALAVLFATIIAGGATAFRQTHVRLDVTFDAQVLDPDGRRDPDRLGAADYRALVNAALAAAVPGVTERRERRELQALVSGGAVYDLRAMVLADPTLVGRTLPLWLPVDDTVDMMIKGHVPRVGAGGGGSLSSRQLAWLDLLAAEGRIEARFNTRLFTGGDSRDAELAGLLGALVGSAFTMLVTIAVAFPLGVATAVYLEELAPRNRWTTLIEVNINNLAAVPSIVFGLLGLAVFLNAFGLPRSAPLAGGLVLALMTLPTIVIAGRASLASVPPSIREAALALGASRMQAVLHHVLPSALPGIITGTIIGVARALGETAPLLMIGMVAFIVDVPATPLDPATVLPVQVFLWADSPERAFVERASAAIIVLLAFLATMTGLAAWLRARFERRW